MNRVLKACEKCIFLIAHTFLLGMGTLIVVSIGYAFYQLFLDLL